MRILAFQWVVYLLLRTVSKVVDLEKQLHRQLSLGQDRADTALAVEAPWGISSGWVEALGLDKFYVVPCPRIPGLRQNRDVVFYAEHQHTGKGNH